MLSLSYGCGLRAGEVVRLKVKHIDSGQIRIAQSKGRKDRNVMLSPKMLDLLREWPSVRLSCCRCRISTWCSRCQADCRHCLI
jgi:integrase